MQKNVAVIDIGSSKVKLVVASFINGVRQDTLYREKRVADIASGLHMSNPAITDEKLNTLHTILSDYANIMSSFDVQASRVIGTDALRRASNIQIAEQLVLNSTGSRIEILTQRQEAQLFFNAVTSVVSGRVAIADIGGGSVQVSIGSSGVISHQYFMRTGTVTLASTFVKTNFSRREDLLAAQEYVQRQIETCTLSKTSSSSLVYGSTNIVDFFRESGTGRDVSARDAVHPIRATVDDVRQLYNTIVQYPYEQQAKFFPSDPLFMYRADMSLINILYICEALGVEEVIPTNLNLSDSVLLSLV